MKPEAMPQAEALLEAWEVLPESKYCECDLGECRTDFLPLLYEMSHIAMETGQLSNILQILLQLMQRHLKVVRGMISLREPGTGRIFIHESCGLSPEEEARGIYALGEGVIGKVVQSGEPIVVPRISDVPDFLCRAVHREQQSERNLSFLCVPIVRNGKVMGTISAERLYDNRRLLKLDAEILAILAATTAQAVELHLLETVQKVALEDENRRLRSALQDRFRPTNLIGNSKAMQEVYGLIEKVTRSRTTVLILGESGVGKELVASAIHYNSPCADGPFIKFNCAALPESVIESELFGHERGAFTGAAQMRRGRFEEADGGTIFLDEVGELSLPMQAKLLRVLQEKSFERVGGNATIQVDIRILAATNRDLLAMVEQGKFREDLYYRLHVFPITIPPLRERGTDVSTLAQYFVSRFASEMGVELRQISSAAMSMLMCYHWPGNVRELENVIERAVILSEGPVIAEQHLPPSLQTPVVSEIAGGGTLEARLNSAEYDMIVEALKQHRGNMTEAATHLGLTRRILGLRMARYHLNYKEYR
ncbi:sigma-54-dependent Fis family transcriptional regulator [Azovibrio restrictus]|uniref:sigma-54 interaction domain-containing protein n=1 Tax=Azovibrio restrictus TaxID=146938 RepID=UPI0026EF3F74|nr:sigma 54-interacting transcriptional regulator [Azovibrio restrictus]MDD3484114.1 sigma 54-interacting transcriptional regulator [Azovibrio restrictus]